MKKINLLSPKLVNKKAIKSSNFPIIDENKPPAAIFDPNTINAASTIIDAMQQEDFYNMILKIDYKKFISIFLFQFFYFNFFIK